MPNRYNTHLIKAKASYSPEDMGKLFGIGRKTCSRWINERGLKVIEENVRPLVRGEVLIEFIKKENAKRKIKLNEDEFFCMTCHGAVRAKCGSEEIVKTGKRIGKNNLEQLKKTGLCDVCGRRVNKFLKVCQID